MDVRSQLRGMVVLALFFASFVVGAGCIGQGRFSEDICNAGGSFDVLGSIDPVIELDYLALRLDGGTYDEYGEPCATASDPAACAEALDMLSPHSEFVGPSFEEASYYTLVFTRGSMVGTIATRTGLKEFLGEINTPAEAGLFALLNGHRIVCTEKDEVGFVDGGFEVLTRTGDGCSRALEHHVLFVGSDGSFAVRKSVTKSLASPGCQT